MGVRILRINCTGPLKLVLIAVEASSLWQAFLAELGPAAILP